MTDHDAWRAAAASRPGYATYAHTPPGDPSWWPGRWTPALAVPVAPGVRCWWCGAEPDLAEVSTIADTKPQYVVAGWPAGDHDHAERPPTPGELVAAGHRILRRLLEEL